jgi:large subunit ribosomal protein L9
MEVILLERVGKLGSVGDVVRVKDGFARNYLIPQMKVLRATNANKALFEERRAVIEQENITKREQAQGIAKTVEGMIVTIIRQAGEDGRLFGSVNSRDIAIAIQEKGTEIKRESVVLIAPIKAMGIHQVRVSLHAEVNVTVNVNVARTETEANDAARAFLAPKKTVKASAPAEETAAPEATETAETSAE